MNRADRRVIAIARVLAGIRQALGLPPDTRADLKQAFAAEDGQLEQLHDAIGRVITADKSRARAMRARRFFQKV